jgi:hypothetical protein
MTDRDQISALYAQSLDAFTKARDQLAAQLRAEGKEEAAAEVKKLKKPSVSVWTVNRLAHERSGDLERLFELRDRLRDSDDARERGALTQERHSLIAELVRGAEAILTAAGHAASSSTLQRVSQTFYSAGDADRDALLGGRLSQDLAASGFDDMAGVLGSDVSEVSGSRTEEREQERERSRALRQEAEEAEAYARESENAALEAEGAAKKARARAEAAHRNAQTARARARDAAKNANGPNPVTETRS